MRAARKADFEGPPQYLDGLFASARHLGGLAPQLQVVHTELTFGVGVSELGASLRPARRSMQLSCMDQPIRAFRLHLASISQSAAVG
ncbi:MAG: hypothetical protein IPL43_13835 [Micropruina sp.]|nr:hypothetical protein [Micropruina sp.]